MSADRRLRELSRTAEHLVRAGDDQQRGDGARSVSTLSSVRQACAGNAEVDGVVSDLLEVLPFLLQSRRIQRNRPISREDVRRALEQSASLKNAARSLDTSMKTIQRHIDDEIFKRTPWSVSTLPELPSARRSLAQRKGKTA